MRIDEIQILLDQGRIALNQGRFDESQELIDRVLAEDEQNEQALNLKGLLLFKQERFHEAVGLFGTLVAKYPDEPTLLMNLGVAYLKSEQYPEAIVELNKALEANPGNPKIHNYLGLAHSGTGQLREAQDHFMHGGSKKMADQMLAMMMAKSGEEPAEEVEVEVDEADIEVEPAAAEAGDDSVDSAFEATFQANGNDANTEEVADIDEGAFGEVAPADAVEVAEAVEVAASDPHPAADEAPAPPAAAEPPAPAAAAAAEPPAAAGPVPTDLLGSALHLLKDRYDAVLETLEAGKGLSELAELLRLKRAPDAIIDHIRPNLVRVQVQPEGTTLARLAGVLAMEGNIRAEPRKKRYKGKDIKSTFGGEQNAVYELIGAGAVYLTAPEDANYFPLRLDGELLYLVEDVFACIAGEWRWENGRLPGQSGRDLHLVQLRGKGAVALTIDRKRRLAAIPLSGQKITLPAASLAGWFGNIVPVLVDLSFPHRDAEEGAVQFQGDGTVLVRIPGH